GIWCRGVDYGQKIAWSEQSFVTAAHGTRKVERNFRSFYPQFPRGSELLVSVEQTGTLGMTQTIYQGQAAKVWYGDSSLETRLPEQRRSTPGPEFLFRLTSGLNLLEIDPDRMVFRSSDGHPPHPDEVGRTIRSYARGLAATGASERAIGLLTHLAE